MDKLLARREKEKKDKHVSTVMSNKLFSPFILSADVVLVKEALFVLTNLS